MVNALVLLLLSQDPAFCYRSPRAGSDCRAGGRSGSPWAFFEAFPVGGAGTGGNACPLPNWVIQSDAIDNASWVKNVDSAPRNATITANYDGVADRFEIPATVPGAQYSRILQNLGASWPGGPATCSLQIKGTSGSGSIPIYLNTVFPAIRTICSFTSAEYTACSLSSTTTAASEVFYVGPSGSVADGSFPAIDVLVKNIQCNVGSTAAPYVATTTAAMGYSVTGARGEPLTFTRASTAMCTRTATGGLATTSIANGDLVLMPSNQPRVMFDSAGTLGLLSESTRTNLLFQFIAIDTAVTWTDVGTPTLTTGQTDPLGATRAVQIDDNDGAAFEGRAQSVAVVAASAYFMHCYVKAGTRAEARISIDGTTQDITGLSATTWSIVEKADASASGVNIPVQVLVGDAVGDTGTVIFGGCQVELGAYRTSIIPTTTIAVARAADRAWFTNAQLPSGTIGSAAATLTMGWASAVGGLHYDMSYSGSAQMLYGAASDERIYDGVTQVIQATTWVPNVAQRVSSSWSGSSMSATTIGGTTAGAFDTTMTTSVTLYIGNQNAPGTETNGVLSRLCLDPDPARCR